MRVLVTGATGFIGSFLTGLLVARGDRVSIVSRHPERVRNARSNCDVVGWLPDLSDYDAVVNLAGEPLFGKRWNDAQRRVLRDSRVEGTRRLVQALAEAEPRPRVLVSGSAIGWYGDRGDEVLREDARRGDDDLAGLCDAWEQEALAAERHGVRTVVLRIGVVLGNGGGALAKMLTPFKLGVGGPIGAGKQWMSWILLKDLARMMLWAIDTPEVRGAYNAVAPNPATNKDFSRALGRALGRPALLPTPPFALRLAFGEVAQLLTDSQRCSAEKALAAGFAFEQPTLDGALAKLLRK